MRLPASLVYEVTLRLNGQSIRHKPILFSSYIGCALPSSPARRHRPLSFDVGLLQSCNLKYERRFIFNKLVTFYPTH